MNDYLNACLEANSKDEVKVASSMRDLILDIVGEAIVIHQNLDAIELNMFGTGASFDSNIDGTESFESLLVTLRSILGESLECSHHICDKIGG